MKRLPVIAITMGDPAGVGPEVCLRAVRDPRVRRFCVPLLVGDLEVLRRHARKMRLGGRLAAVSPAAIPEGALGPSAPAPVIDLANVAARHRVFGQVRAALGRAAGAYIECAVRLVLEGRAAAVATGPIHKEAFRAGGYAFPGHTEMLAHLCRGAGGGGGGRRPGGGGKREGAGEPVMMLAHGRVRIAHLSTHLPLRRAIGRIRRGRVLRVIRLLAGVLEGLDRRPPRIAVAGLNPHAGEGGLFGREEIEEIAPAVEDARAEGIDARGPEPPDTVFAKLRGRVFDGAVAMYHDQGHIAGKLMAFRFDAAGRGAVRGVNVTLGLPIVRTSVEHGAGFEIAGRGEADHASMVDALRLAARLVRSRAAGSQPRGGRAAAR